ncbi:MAG: YIP1 family protein [Longimicrobiales bacterium]
MNATVGLETGVLARAIGAALLRPDVYENIEADRSATGQAATVVLVVALASAIAAYNAGTGAIIGSVIGAFVNWAIFAAVTNFIGTRVFGGHADWGELLRTLGFAQAPGVFLLLTAVPFLGGLAAIVVALWTLAACIVAIRQALDFTTGRAVLTAIIAAMAIIAVTLIVGAITGFSLGGVRTIT